MNTTSYQDFLPQNNIRKFRTELQLRQADLADVIGLGIIDRVSHWENGKAVPGLINLVRLCVLYNVTLQDLYPQLYTQVQEEILSSTNRKFLMSRALKAD